MRLTNSYRLLVVGAALLFAGCGVMGGFYRQRPIRFNHRVHVETGGMECASCHPGIAEGKEPGMPSIEDCRGCHSSAEDEGKKIKPFLDKDGKPNFTQVTQLPEDLKFEHTRHLKTGLKCADCHVGVEKSRGVNENMRITKDKCMGCHADRKQPSNCQTCHQKISEQWEPPSHDRNWSRQHGQVVRDDSNASSDRCSLCHSETYCSDCHLNTKPQDHTNMWRLKTHGASAAVDRERCTACHRTDFCRYCHMTTQPYTHTQAWKPPTSLHCQNCHFPLEETNCYVCHKQAHTEGGAAAPGENPVPPPVNAPPLPSNSLHQTVSETQCSGCHRLSARHPPVTTNCRNCHR